MISETVSHHRVLKKLGEGGMGEVYLAEDTRLGRKIALRLLPASYQYDSERRTKFVTEARAASALRSPNIAAIYDIGEHDDAMFIAMEYVDGEVLSQRIARRTMPTSEIIWIATQIADTLDEAHALGIVHRDIKSDFGLAKVIRPESAGDHTDTTVPLSAQTALGVVMGTVSYMSRAGAWA